MNLNRQCENLIKELKEGNKPALAGLYNLLGRQMYVVAYNVLSDHQLTEDSIQESLITVSEKACTVTDTASARSWILKVVRNKALDILRNRNREFVTEDFELYDKGYNESERAEKSVDVESALKLLKEEDRQIVLMKCTMGFSHKEIAEILKISIETCQKRYQRALRSLKNYLK